MRSRDCYLVVPKGYLPPPVHTTWQGAALDLASIPKQDDYEVVNVELIEEG